MTDRDALIRRIARHEFPDPRVVRSYDHRGPHPATSDAPAADAGPARPRPVAYDEPRRPQSPA